MTSSEQERNYWREFRRDTADNLERLEPKPFLANPKNMSDDEHDFLIKKMQMFRETISQIDDKLKELEQRSTQTKLWNRQKNVSNAFVRP